MNTSMKNLRIIQILRTTLAVSLLGVGLAACVAQSEPGPDESNVSSAESDLTSPLSVAPVANACVQPRRPTSGCAIGWHWCGCPDPNDPFPRGWVCGVCE